MERSIFGIKETEDVGALRRAVRRLGNHLAVSDRLLARAELAATELGTNALFHAQPTGTVVLQPMDPALGAGLELLAIDHGPGIADLAGVLRGPSQQEIVAAIDAGDRRRRGMGCGLASVTRLATESDIHTEVGRGTVVLARFFEQPAPQAPAMRCGGITVPIEADGSNGDGWACVTARTELSVLLIDGLGHGPHAEVAAQAGLAAFREHHRGDLEDTLVSAHRAMRGTRGGAGSLCRIVPSENRLLFAGCGNVEGRILNPGQRSRGLAPRGGTLGMNDLPPRLQLIEYDWGPGAMLVMHSDGIRAHHDFDADAKLCKHDPSVIAAVLYREQFRGRDDATVVVVKDTRATQP